MRNRFIQIDPVNKTILTALETLSQALELDDHEEKLEEVTIARDFLNVILADDEKSGIAYHPGFQPYEWKKTQNKT